jgi:hypothetical protein
MLRLPAQSGPRCERLDRHAQVSVAMERNTPGAYLAVQRPSSLSMSGLIVRQWYLDPSSESVLPKNQANRCPQPSNARPANTSSVRSLNHLVRAQ